MGPRAPSVRWPLHDQNRRNQSAVGQSGGVHPRGRFDNKKPETKKPEIAQQSPVRADPTPKVRLSPAKVVSKAVESLQIGNGFGGTPGFRRCRRTRSDCVEGGVEESSRSSDTSQSRLSSRRRVLSTTSASNTPHVQDADARGGCGSTAIGAHLSGAVGCRLGRSRSISAGSRRALPEKPEELGDTSELADLRRQVQHLRKERDSWLSNRGGYHQTDGVGGIPADPSSLMLGLIEAGDAKRRCLGNMGSSMPSSLTISVR